MKQTYYGTVNGQCTGVVYENWYEDRKNAVTELRRKAKELVRQSFDEYSSAYYTLYLGGTVVASGEIPRQGLRHIRMDYPDYVRPDYTIMPLHGVRIC
jgi:hypothetical protein